MISFIISLLILPCTISILYFKYIKKETDLLSACACNIFFIDVVMNGFFYLQSGKSILNQIDPDVFFYITFFIGACLCTWICDQLQTWMKERGGLPIYQKTTFITAIIFFNLFVYFMWLLGESGRMSFDLFMYNLVTPVNEDASNFDVMIFGMGLFMLILTTCIVLMLWKPILWQSLSFRQRKKRSKKIRVAAIALPILLLGGSLYYPFYTFHLEDAYAYFYEEDTFIENAYVDPNITKMTWSEEKQNLIYIFVESFEASSFSRELGGLNEENLLPQLTKWMDQGVYFSNHPTLYGGAMTMPQATVTMSGMATALTGVNYKIPAELENDEYAVTVSGITSLNDLLYEQGYEQFFLCGVTPDNYNIGKFYRAHGNAITTGWPEKIAAGVLPEDYKVWWGYEDSKLFEYAKEDLSNMNDNETPFFYVINTSNTHRTDGYLEPTCSAEHEYPMQNAIACEDQMLSDFLTWAKQQPFYDNTTIVVVGDHLGHNEAYTEYLQPQEDRRIFNLILNEKSPIQEGSQQNRQFFAGDMFPTVLSAIGVEIEGNRLGLGTNLFSDRPTIIEETSAEFISEALGKNSVFYTEKFLTNPTP